MPVTRPAKTTAAVAFLAVTLALSLASCTPVLPVGQPPATLSPPAAMPTDHDMSAMPTPTATGTTAPGGTTATGSLPTTSPPASMADLPAPTPDVDPAGATPWAYPAGADVTIGAGEKVLVDRSVTAGAVTVAAGGALLVADTDLTLSARSVVTHGVFQAGTMSDPLTSDVTIELTETDPGRDVVMPGMNMGAGVFGAMDTGVVKLYGARGREGFVHLAADAAAGSTSLSLNGPLSLVPGDVVVVGSTSFEPSETERCTVTATTPAGPGSTVTCAAPLAHDHLGRDATFAGTTVSMRAPVALLTRNLVLTQSAAATAAGVNGHTHFTGTGAVEIVGVQAIGLGDGGEIGHYPFHMHDKGTTTAAFFAYNSVTDSANRAIVTHLTDGARVIGNVTDNVAGHAFMIAEDGVEVGTLVSGNLSTRVTEPANTLRESDQNPANFWFGNASHDVRGNEAGGAEGGWGFFVESLSAPVGLAATKGRTGDPSFLPLGRWQGNTAHSISEPDPGHECSHFGCGTGFGIFSHQPVRDGSPWQWEPNNRLSYLDGVPWGLPQAVVYDSTVWKTEGMGVWAESMIGFERLRVLDTRDGFFGSHNLIDDSLFVGESGVGAQLPNRAIVGVKNYDGHRDVKDTVFVNYVDRPDRRAAAFGNNGSYTSEEIGFYGVSAVENVSFVDANPFWFENGDSAQKTHGGDTSVVVWDLDGSLTGAGARSYLTFAADPAGGCRTDAVALAKVCPESSAPADFTGTTGVNHAPPASLPELADQPAP